MKRYTIYGRLIPLSENGIPQPLFGSIVSEQSHDVCLASDAESLLLKLDAVIDQLAERDADLSLARHDYATLLERWREEQQHVLHWRTRGESAESRLDSAENAMREVVSHLQRSQRGSTHWAGCTDVHPVCQAIDMLVDALPLRDVERTVTNEETQ